MHAPLFEQHKVALAHLERVYDQRPNDGGAHDVAYDASWAASDRVIAAPADGIDDLAAKVAVIRNRLALSSEMISSIEDYVMRLFDDIERLAARYRSDAEP